MSNSFFLLFCILSLLSTEAYAQTQTSQGHFTEIVREESGDLNHDGRDDKVLVKMDIVSASRPLLLQVFLSQPDKKLKLAVSSAQLIEPQYPANKKGKFNGFQIPDFLIENGSLSMITETKDGNITHHFKLRNGNFELCKVNQMSYDGANTTVESEFNLLTGIKIETEKQLGSEKIVSRRKKAIKITKLPKLQDFKYTDKMKY